MLWMEPCGELEGGGTHDPLVPTSSQLHNAMWCDGYTLAISTQNKISPYFLHLVNNKGDITEKHQFGVSG
jgi:hypothetical protein